MDVEASGDDDGVAAGHACACCGCARDAVTAEPAGRPAVAVAAAAAFLTPVATPTNLMVMEPGDYRFGDYWKFGLPMMVWFFVVAVGLVPVIWPF